MPMAGDTQRLLGSKAPFAAAIVAVSFAVYSGTLSGGFVYDDNYHILANPWITDLRYVLKPFYSSVWEFLGGISAGMNNYYRPVMHLIFTLEYHIFGFQPWGWHLFNIAFHSANGVLVFLIVGTLLETEEAGAAEGRGASANVLAFMAAVIFAVHPVATEVVAWVSAITELSFTLFYLTAFYLYMRSVATGKRVLLALSVLSFFLSALSKETSATLPLLIVGYDLARKRSIGGRDVLRYAPYAAAGAVYIVLRLNALHGMAPRGRMHPYLDASQYALNAFPLFIEYLKTLVYPVRLIQFHIFDPVYSITEPRAYGAVILTLLFLFVAWRLSRRSRTCLMAFIFFVVPLLPVFYIPGLARNTFAERYLYVPSVGFVLLIALAVRWLVARAGPSKGLLGAVAAVFVIVVSACAYGTVTRSREWKDEFTLWNSIVRKYPDHYYGLSEAGTVLNRNGDPRGAIPFLEKSVRLNAARRYPEPMTLVHARHELADAYFNLGLLARAAPLYREVLDTDPGRFGANYNLAVIYRKSGRYDEAIALFSRAIETAKKPVDRKDAYLALGNVYAGLGRWERAVRNYRSALALSPDDAAVLNNLAVVEGRMKRAAPSGLP